MNKPHQLERGRWLKGYGAKVADAVMAKLPPGASEELKLAVMESLVEKLQGLREFDRWDPRSLESVVFKRNYREVNRISVTHSTMALQVLPDGRIVAGTAQGMISLFTPGAGGSWIREDFPAAHGAVRCLQVFPDGRIVSGGDGDSLRVWTKSEDGAWRGETLRGHTKGISCLQALPDGRIVSGSYDGSIRTWTKEADGSWDSEYFRTDAAGVRCLLVFPDDRIVLSSSDGMLRMWAKEKDMEETWSLEDLGNRFSMAWCLRAFADDRIVAANDRGPIRIWTRDRSGAWSDEDISEVSHTEYCLQALPDGRIVSGGTSRSISIWSKSVPARWSLLSLLPWSNEDIEWRREELQGHSGDVLCLQVLADGRIVSGSSDGTIRIWDGDEVTGGIV